MNLVQPPKNPAWPIDAINVTLSETPEVSKLPFKHFALASGEKEGLIQSWEPTGFDNITCSGNDQVLQSTSEEDYLEIETNQMFFDQEERSITVEFWLKIQNWDSRSLRRKTVFSMSLVGDEDEQEYMAIKTNSLGQLVCKPFSSLSTSEGELEFPVINQLYEDAFKWFHVVCRFQEKSGVRQTWTMFKTSKVKDKKHMVLDKDLKVKLP